MRLQKVGTDVEFFLIKDGTIIPSQGVIPGTKAKPYKLSVGLTHRDNVLCEIAMEPGATAKEFSDNLRKVMTALRKEILDPMGVLPHIVPSYILQEEQLYHPEAQTVGCDADYDCYSAHPNPAPSLILAGNFRCGAAHIHASFDDVNPYRQLIAARSMDLFVGLGSVHLDSKGVERKQKLYGKAGAFRRKPYGIEYRVPSNWWVSNPLHHLWIFDHTKAAIENAEWADGVLTPQLIGDLRRTINNGDVRAAVDMRNFLGLDARVEESKKCSTQ